MRTASSGSSSLTGLNHWIINYKDTKTICRPYWCLIKFKDGRDSQSCWYFRSSFVNYCPSNLLSGSPPPPLPCVKVHYIQTVCGWEGGGGCWVVLETIFWRSLTLCIWPALEPRNFPYHPKQKPRRGEGLRLINTSRKVTLQVKFFITTFGIAFYQSNLSTV